MKKGKLKMIFWVSFCLIVLVGIVGMEAKENHNPISEIEVVKISYDYSLSTSLEEMVDNAELIVVGKYIDFEKTWNMARNPNNIQEEDDENYVEGKLYSFEVENVLKGTINSDQILVNHRYAEALEIPESNAVIDNEGNILEAATKENIVSIVAHDPRYIEPQMQKQYILFLLEDKNFGHYYGATEPFSILKENGMAVLQTNLLNRSEDFYEEINITEDRTVGVSVDVKEGMKDFLNGKTTEDVIDSIKEMMK